MKIKNVFGKTIISRVKVNSTKWLLKVAVGEDKHLDFANLQNENLEAGRFELARLNNSNFQGANLKGVDLSWSDLNGANFQEANLENADLRYIKAKGANFSYANLRGAVLSGGDLLGADFSGADLDGARLCSANLISAKFTSANCNEVSFDDSNLDDAIFCRANLVDSSFWHAKLNNADFREADIKDAYFGTKDISTSTFVTLAHARGVKEASFPFISKGLPEGEFIGWKRLRGNIIAKLKIPADSKRLQPLTLKDKFRCDKALVLELYNVDGTPSEEIEGRSISTYDFRYRVGAMVYADEFNEDVFKGCTHGIYFFLDRQKAVDY